MKIRLYFFFSGLSGVLHYVRDLRQFDSSIFTQDMT